MKNIDPLEYVESVPPREVSPDFLIGFHRYWGAMMVESAIHWHDTGERIPTQVVREAIAAAFGITLEVAEMWEFAGAMIDIDRNPIEDDEDYEVDEDAETYWEQALEKAHRDREQADAEVEMLRKLFDL